MTSRTPRGEASRLTKSQRRAVLSNLKQSAINGDVKAGIALIELELSEKTAPANESRKARFQIDFQDCEKGTTP